MKKHTKKLTKMQRKVRSQRKTWTNARRFELKMQKMQMLVKKNNMLVQKLLKEAEEEMTHQHDHGTTIAVHDDEKEIVTESVEAK